MMEINLQAACFGTIKGRNANAIFSVRFRGDTILALINAIKEHNTNKSQQ